MMKTVLAAFLSFFSFPLFAQEQGPYQFTKIIDIACMPVASQGKTGTCWSFSTTSFLESEIYRADHQWVDLSEMYNPRVLYPVKMFNYISRQGHAQFGEGGLSHDVLRAFALYGAVPEADYDGLAGNGKSYDHTEMVRALTALADSAVQDEQIRMNWKSLTEKILDTYMGAPPDTFTYKGVTYTPLSFSRSLHINPENYIEFTSFGFEPYYSRFILNIPDNFENGAYWNVPLDSLTRIIDNALENGYTVALDCDVSEPTFLRNQLQIAVFPEEKGAGFKKSIVPEHWITAGERDRDFLSYATEDDHLMHIVGLYEDQLGNRYYKVKNSWGTGYAGKGYWMISKAFIRAKAIGIMVNKNAVSDALKAKTFGRS